MTDFLKISTKELRSEFLRILLSVGFNQSKAESCADVFTSNSVDGVYSHGVNRFPKFVQMVKSGIVVPSAEATQVLSLGNIERWDGKLGPGPINALMCTDRAMELASVSGIGCVALGRTNHWMRGGTYGWRAARRGFVFIGWSNTIANTPPWGAINHKLGNNPLVIAIPYKDEAIVLDIAMSQFSYGAMEMYELKNEQLPVHGGYDSSGNLTTDPVEIKKSQRTLPIGFWKGAGLSLLLDILGTVLSGGLSVHEITSQEAEKNLSQMFIAIDLKKFGDQHSITKSIQSIVDDLHTSIPVNPGDTIRYPGENVVKMRVKNLQEGIPVSRKIWEEIKSL